MADTESPVRDRLRFWNSLRFRFGASYLLIMAAVLSILNTYPLLVSEDMVFRSKETSMLSSVSLMVSSLSGLDRLNRENVASALAGVEEGGLSRVLVSDGAGKILYDTRETGGAVGDYVLYSELVQALLGNDAFSSIYQKGAFRSRAASPVLYRNQIIGAVYAYEYDRTQAALLLDLQRNLIRITWVISAALVLLIWILSAALTAQIRELLTAIREVRKGAYSHRAAVRGRDEIALIGREFNSLTDRLQITEDARRQFVSDASHELKTPLAAIRLLSDSITQTDNIDLDTTREFVSDIGAEADRLSRITADLLRLTRLDSGVLDPSVPVDPLPVLEQVFRMANLVAQERGIELTYHAEEDCLVPGTKDEVYQVLYNLVDNAVKYSGDGGAVQVTLGRDGDGHTVLTVEDNGGGIPEQDLSRIFERFYRVDKARSRAAGGTGLGLSIVRDTVRRRGGTITAGNRPQGGAVFTVIWPQAEGGGES